MEVVKGISLTDQDQSHLRQNFPDHYQRNVRSMSYCPPPTSAYLLQRPQMRPFHGDVNIIDLTEKKKLPAMRKSKSTVSKPSIPEHHKGRRLSKYLGIHRMSLTGLSSESAKTKNGTEDGGKSILRRFSKNHIEDGTKSLDRRLSKKRTDDRVESVSKRFSLIDTGQTGCSEAVEADYDANSDENLEIHNSSPESVNSISVRQDTRASMEKRDAERDKIRVSPPTLPEQFFSHNIDAPKVASFSSKNFVHHSTDLRNGQQFGKTKNVYSTLSYREKFDMTCKVVLLGDSGVGKTCLLMKFKDGAFLSGSYISTVGIDFRNKVVNIDGAKVKLQIWDTAGQERFRSVTHAYYRDAHALLLLYDVTSKTTFDNTRAWLAEVHEYAQDDVVIMLIGNKCDAPITERQIRKEDGERLAREYNVAFMETSAKTGLNVDLAFNAVARDLKARKSDNIYERNFNVSDYVQKEAKSESCGCSLG